jgi:CheY-like chemotaxis protein
MPVALHLAKEAKEAKGQAFRKGKVKEKEPLLPEAKEAPPKSTLPGQGRRLLVVDDNQVVLKAFQMRLQADGFTVSTTANAAEVASTAEENKSELIILDINFPPSGAMEWNGFTVMQWVQRFPELARLPVILITGSEQAQYKKQAIASGAFGFFEKPVDYSQLLEAILRGLPPAPA